MALGKRVRTVFCIFLPSILLLALFPFFVSVKAEDGSYIPVELGCVSIFKDTNYYVANINQNGRGVILHDTVNNLYYGYIFSETFFRYYWTSYNSIPSSCGTPNNDSVNFNGKYYVRVSAYGSITETYFPVYNMNISSYVYLSDYNQKAYDLTYGTDVVDPTPSINHGDLIIEGFSTDIAGQGEASLNNIDHIKWNNSVDSNGNDISNYIVRFRIVPGQYTAPTKEQIVNSLRESLVLEINNSYETYFDNSTNEYSISWREVVNLIDTVPYRIWNFEYLGPDWRKDGWVYQLRLENEDLDYVGNWQTVYSSTSNGVSNDLVIANNTTINQEFISVLQSLNTVNSVSNNWQFMNTEISVSNTYTEPSSGKKPWWAYLLESILNTFNITNNYIYEGDTNTQNITNTVNDSDDNMNRKIGEYQQFEDTFIDDMDSNLTDIDTEIDFLSDNKFIASANWVAQQYNRMTNNNVIGSFIGFSLLFGLALIFIGKIR